MNYDSSVLKLLTGIAEDLEAMPDLPDACTPESLADHDAFMATHEMINRKMRDAEVTALIALPEPVEAALERVRKRVRILRHVSPAQLLAKHQEVASDVGSGKTTEVEPQVSHTTYGQESHAQSI